MRSFSVGSPATSVALRVVCEEMFVVFAFDVRHDTLANQSRVYQFLTQRLLVVGRDMEWMDAV